MIKDILYDVKEAVRNQKGVLTDERREVRSYPDQLNEQARGQFPVLEQALLNRGVVLPDEWSIGNLLACVGVGLVTIIREDRGLRRVEPKQIELIVDEYHHKGDGQYNMIGFAVETEGLNIYGSLRMPGFYPENPQDFGLPWFVQINDERASSGYAEQNLVDQAGEFSRNGQRLVNFIAGIVK